MLVQTGGKSSDKRDMNSNSALQIANSQSSPSNLISASGELSSHDMKPTEMSLEKMAQAAGLSLADMKTGGVLQVVLVHVVKGDYHLAQRALEWHQQSMHEYETFLKRSEKYFAFCHETIQAIKVKKEIIEAIKIRNSKAHELGEKVNRHFKDLKQTLSKIQQVEREIKLEDIRSTLIVVKASCYIVLTVFGFLFLREMWGGTLKSISMIYSDVVFYLLSLIP